jgi:purine-binding chemotaxis protein CheW
VPKSKTSSTINALLKLAAVPVKLGPAEETRDVEHISALVFETGDERFAIVVENIEGVVDCPRVTPLPNPPEDVIGVASVRGRMTLVVCPNASSFADDSRKRLILLKGDSQLGLLADRIEDVVSLSQKELRHRGSRKGKEAQEGKNEKNRRASFTYKGCQISLLDVEQLGEA